MLILGAILLIFLTPLVVFGIGFTRVRSGYLWLLVTTSTLIAFSLILLSGNKIPISIPIANWQPEIIFTASPMLLVDNISWPFAIAIITFVFAALLIDIVHINKPIPQSWILIHIIGGVGLIAVIAGNLLTILIAWAVIDIVECVILLNFMHSSRKRERVVISFSVRIASMIMLISAILIGEVLDTTLPFGEASIHVAGLLILAAGLRLGIFPLNQPYLQEPQLRRNLGTMIRFIPSVASIVLLGRIAHVGITGFWFLIIMILSTVLAIFSAVFWLQADNELDGQIYWISGISAFALAAASQGLQNASTAWGLAMIFSGGLLFLLSKSHIRLIPLFALGVFSISGLPLSPTWEGAAQIFSLPWSFRVFFIIAQALMMVGYLRFALLTKSNQDGFERWMWFVYPIGLAILPITNIGLFYVMRMFGYQNISLQTPGWWGGLISFGLAVIIFVKYRYKSISFHPFLSRFVYVISWISRSFWWGYQAFGRLLYAVTRILEGDGSILWALLILILLTVTINLWGDGERFGL